MPDDPPEVTPTTIVHDKFFEAISDIRKDGRETRDCVKAFGPRIERLEGDCRDLAEDGKATALKVNTMESSVAGHSVDLTEIKTSRSKLVYWIGGAIIMVIAAAFGWYGSFTATQTEVQNIRTNQTKMQKALSEQTTAVRQGDKAVTKELKAVQTAVKAGNGHNNDRIKAFCAGLEPAEKRYLQRRGKLPIECWTR